MDYPKLKVCACVLTCQFGVGWQRVSSVKTVKIAIIVRLQDSGEQEDGGKEAVETSTEKEGKQETVDTPLTSPSDDVLVQVYLIVWFCFVFFFVFV